MRDPAFGAGHSRHFHDSLVLRLSRNLWMGSNYNIGRLDNDTLARTSYARKTLSFVRPRSPVGCDGGFRAVVIAQPEALPVASSSGQRLAQVLL